MRKICSVKGWETRMSGRGIGTQDRVEDCTQALEVASTQAQEGVRIRDPVEGFTPDLVAACIRDWEAGSQRGQEVVFRLVQVGGCPRRPAEDCIRGPVAGYTRVLQPRRMSLVYLPSSISYRNCGSEGSHTRQTYLRERMVSVFDAASSREGAPSIIGARPLSVGPRK